MSWLEGPRARVRLLFGRRAAEGRMEEEIRFHIEMETERLVREEGLEPSEARRRALVAFGGVDSTRERMREGRGLGGLGGLSLDLKLGLRMLVKYPGLTVVGGLAIAFAICIGAGAFELLTQAFNPTLPLPGGERVIGVRMWDASRRRVEARVAHDFVVWRRGLSSVEELGAFRTIERNLVAGDGAAEPLGAAEMTAAGFRIARVRPVLGRALVDADERIGAAQVVVIGHDVWQTRFGGDSNVVGRVVRIGREPATVVGVMPEGFAFPVAHSVWLPLRLNAQYEAGEGPAITVFGRLAPGASRGQAAAELNGLTRAMSAEAPEVYEHLRAQVLPYALSILNGSLHVSGELDLTALAALLRMALNVPLVLFLLLVCGNVALLVFARAATRESEIVVRNALGASRRRIIVQLFLEALVLGAVAATVGLAAAHFVLRWGVTIIGGELLNGARLPFWIDPRVSPATMLYAAALTVAGAAVAGALPALKVTRDMGTRLRQASAGGGGFRFGGVWTLVVVSQVAITVPFPIVVLALRSETSQIRAVDVGLVDEQYLSARLELDRETTETATHDGVETRFETTLHQLEQRLSADPAVTGVTFAERLPRMYHPYRLVELDSGEAAPLHPQWPAYRVSSVSIDPYFFDVLGVGVLSGRDFHSGDVGADARPVIVNQPFVERVLGGRNAVGRRLRYVFFDEAGPLGPPEEQPWYEIVGVVRDLGTSYGEFDPKIAAVYHPAAPAAMRPLHLAVHTGGDAASFGPRLRALAAAVDPAIRLYDIQAFDRITDSELRFYEFWFWFTIAVSGIALLLALAGIYAIMSFTVAQRTREIGIRIALGADRRRIIMGVFRRPLVQLLLGVVAGAAVLSILLFGSGANLTPRNLLVLLADLAITLGVCMIAWIVPTRRALSIAPGDALRWE